MKIRQDSQDQILADNWIFDGFSFREKDPFSGKRFYAGSAESYYVAVSPYKYLYIINGEVTDSLDVSIHTHFPNSEVVVNDNKVTIVNANGALFYDLVNGKHEFIKLISVPSREVRHIYQINDTLFFKDTDRNFYVTEDNLEETIYYGKEDLSHFPTFYLPRGRIVLNKADGDTIIPPQSAWAKVINQFDDDELLYNLIDSEGRLWLSLNSEDYKGLHYCYSRSEEIFPIQYSKQEKFFPVTLYEDHQGSIWAGTEGNGMYQIYEQGIQIIGKGIGLETDNIWSIHESSEGNLYLSTDKPHIDIISPDLNMEFKNTSTVTSPIIIDQAQNVWLKAHGACQYNLEISFLKEYAKAEGLYSRSPSAFFEDANQTFWVGTRKCLHRLKKGRFIQYPVPDIGEFDHVFNIVEVESEKLLVAVASGRAYLFENEKFSEVQGNYSKIYRIIKDPAGHIWAASENDGLLRFENDQFHPIGGFPRTIYQLQYDDQGQIWGITDDNRVFSISINQIPGGKEELDIDYYSAAHGLPLIDLNLHLQPSSTLLSNGNIVFPNIYGAISINPTLVKKERQSFRTLINVGNSTLDVNSILELDPGSNSTTLKIVPVTLLPNHPVEYAYLKSNEWVPIENHLQFTFEDLKPGQNELSIKGRYINQDWQEPIHIRIQVPPLYYQTLWFKSAIVLLLASLMYFLVKWRTRRIKIQNIKLQEIIAEQTSELKNEKEQLATSLQVQRKLTKELKLNQASKNRMYAQISHEFRSPLQALKAHLSKSSSAGMGEEGNYILDNLNHLITTSDEILELSKAESGKLKAYKNWYNIQSIIEDQIQLKKPLLTQKNIQVIFNPIESRIQVYLDLSLIQKVIGNLLSNAIKFSPENGLIHLTSELKEDNYYFALEDQGIGISPADLKSITSAYFQGSNNNIGGTGIGLSLVKEILKLHDSNIEIESKLNKGSRFSFKIPYPTDIIPPKSIENGKPNGIINQLKSIINPNKPIIACIDDNNDVLKFLRQTLSSGYNIVTTNRGDELLSCLKEVNPQVIISDVNMPFMDGIELLKSVRKKSRFKAVPFIFLTGSSSEETEIIGLTAGADLIVHKPINVDSLRSKIKRIIDRKEEIKSETVHFFTRHLLATQLQDDEQALLENLDKVILDNIKDPNLKSADIASQLGIGEKTLRNKIKKLTGKTVKEYLRMVRLETAKKLVNEDYGTFSEIASTVGFSSLSYFRKSYKNYFGE